MHLIGVTGGIATGKSTVSATLVQKGYTVIDGDEVARQVVRVGQPALQRIKEHFGPTAVTSSGELDRSAIADLIFNDPEKRRKLNSIVHPEIYRQIGRQCLKCLWMREAIVFLDLPLLFESGTMTSFVSKIIVVSCHADQQLQRLMHRNGLTETEARARINSQMSLEEKCARADFVIDNSAQVSDTMKQVDEVERILSQKYNTWCSRYLILDVVVAAAGALIACLLLKVMHM